MKNFLQSGPETGSVVSHVSAEWHRTCETTEPVSGPDRKKVFIFLPFLGDNHSVVVRRKLRKSTRNTYPAADPCIVFTTRAIHVRSLKDSLSPVDKSHVIYEFQCNCDNSYVGRTERRLSVRVNEHLPQWLYRSSSNSRPSSSAITRHVATCSDFNYHAPPSSYFKVLAQSHHVFHLRVLEALFIIHLKPPLCVQKDFIYTVRLCW